MTGMRSAVAATATTLAIALLATGCGGGDSTTKVTTTTASSVAPATSQPPATGTPTTSVTATTTATAKATVVDDVLKGGAAAERYDYVLTFPKLQGLAGAAVQDSVNAQIRAEMTVAVDEFVSQAKDTGAPAPAPADQHSNLTGTYEVSRLDDGLASLRVRVSRYFAGAAHPGTSLTTFNFDLHTGKRLALADLFAAGSPYLAKLSELSKQLLNAQPGFSELPDFVGPGTEPKDENFAGWTLTDQDLVITFSEYQVAPYAMGMPHVSVPYASLRVLLDPTGPLAAYN